MTDDHQWHAPDSAVQPPPSAPPASPPSASPSRSTSAQYQPTPPAFAPPPPFRPAPPPPPGFGPAGGAPGWTPPPKPGLIPLRPLTLGTILGAAFQTLRRNPGATLAPALILTVIVAVIQALGSAGFLTQYFGAVADASQSGSFDSGSSIPAGLVSGGIGIAATSLVSGVLTLIVTAIIEGIVTLQVASSTIGSRLRLRGLWGRLSGRRGALIGWAFLTGIVPLLAFGVIGGLLFLLGSAGSGGAVLAVILGFLLLAGLAVVSIWLWVKLGFVPAALVLERSSIRTSLARSWRLTRGAFWRIFGIRLLVIVMISIATQVVVTPISLVFSLGGTIISPNGATADSATNSLVLSLIITQGVTAVISAVGLVLSSATTSLLYLDQRIRLEGLDLDLAGYVERRQSGEQGIPDPYRSPDIPVGAV